jgi:tRNA G18 (ribose-2'-O)-methylase SpoU
VKNVYLALENIRSLYNVGSILRSCSFFGVKNVLLVGYSGKDFLPSGKAVLHEKVVKTALDSQNDLNIIFIENSADLIKYGKENNLTLVSVEQAPGAVDLANWIPQDNAIYVLGNEVLGVSSEILSNSELILEIKKRGVHNSLNVTIAAGILLNKIG